MSRRCYAVHVTRRDGWWALGVVGVPGAVTAVESLDAAEPAARRLLAEALGVPADSFDVDLALSPTLPGQTRVSEPGWRVDSSAY